MSSCMYSRTRSHTTRCGPSRTSTFTFRFEAGAVWGRNLMLMNMRYQPSNSTPNLPSQRTRSQYHQTQHPLSRRIWSQCHQTRFWLRIHPNQKYISMMLATSQTCLWTPTTFPT